MGDSIEKNIQRCTDSSQKTLWAIGAIERGLFVNEKCIQNRLTRLEQDQDRLLKRVNTALEQLEHLHARLDETILGQNSICEGVATLLKKENKDVFTATSQDIYSESLCLSCKIKPRAGRAWCTECLHALSYKRQKQEL